MCRDWKTIDGYDAWEKTLTELLAEAADALLTKDPDEIEKMRKCFKDFIWDTDNISKQIKELDALAERAMFAMYAAKLNMSIDGIVERTQEYTDALNKIKKISSEAVEQASALRLDGAKKSLAFIQNLVGIITAAHEGVDSDLIKSKLEQLLSDLEEFAGSG